jgi:hypothetical protein
MDSTFEPANSWHSLSDDLIFRYLRGLLSDKEKQVFERQITEDPFLAESLEGWKQQLHVPQARHVYRQLKKNIHQKAYHRNYRRWVSMTYISALTMAAIIATAVVITKIIDQRISVKNASEQVSNTPPFNSSEQNQPPAILKMDTDVIVSKPDTILAKYHVALIDSLLKVQLENDIPNTFSLRPALMRFENGDYDTAMMMIDHVIHTEPGNHLAWYYGGICQIILNHPVAATRMLLNPSLDVSSERHEAAMWYVGLVKLKIGAPGECREIMQLLVLHGDVYKQQAAGLLQRLQQE